MSDKPRLNVVVVGDADRIVVDALGKREGARRVGHRYVAVESNARRYAFAVAPLKMADPVADDVLHDVIRGSNGADALLVVAPPRDDVGALAAQLAAARTFGVAQCIAVVHASAAADDDALAVRHALVSAGFAGDDAAIVISDVDAGERIGDVLGDRLMDALDRALIDVGRDVGRADQGARGFVCVDEVWGRSGSFHAVARVCATAIAEDDEVLLTDPASGETSAGRILELTSASGARLAVAEPGELVVFHVASALEIDGVCQAVVGARGAVQLARSINAELVTHGERALPTTPARAERCTLYVGHARARLAHVDGGLLALGGRDVVPAALGMALVVVEDGAVLASGRVTSVARRG